MRSRLPSTNVQAFLGALIDSARGGNVYATARLISMCEDMEAAPDVAIALEKVGSDRKANVLGITGAPGAGKSTTVSALVQSFRSKGLRIAVLAIDPSSPYSGGALLGDRVRMREHAADSGVYIRSMASRGALGGLSRATPQAVQALDIVGFDVVILETVGVGQAEVDVLSVADTVVVVSAPGQGDDIQAAKAGILEIADVYAVNKADNPGAKRLAQQLRQTAVLSQTGGGEDRWSRPVVMTIAAEMDVGQLVAAIADHRAWLSHKDNLAQRQSARASMLLRSTILGLVDSWLASAAGREESARLTHDVMAGQIDNSQAATAAFAALAAATRTSAVERSDRPDALGRRPDDSKKEQGGPYALLTLGRPAGRTKNSTLG